MIKAIRTHFPPLESEGWETLTQLQIADRCRARAVTAIAVAEDHSHDLGVSFLEAAEAWTQLADDIEWAAAKTAPGQRMRIAARQLGKVT